MELRALESTRSPSPGSLVGGTVYSCISAFNDYDSNGVLDPRESLIYIPDSVKNNSAEGAPVLVVFPGMTQAASTFMDCSGYWAVANDEGCILLIMGEYCNSSAASLIYGDEEDNVNMTCLPCCCWTRWSASRLVSRWTSPGCTAPAIPWAAGRSRP